MRLSAYVAVCLCASLAAILSGCGGDTTSPPPSNHAAPRIMSHPSNTTVAPGQTATFSTTAAGSPPLTSQGERSQAPISGATSATYTTPAVSTTDNGVQFRVVVSNALG